MAVYAAYRHIELDNVGYGKKRVLKPPGGGSSDIFGAAGPGPDEAPRRRAERVNSSSVPVGDDACETPSRAVKPGNDTHHRLFGEPVNKPSTPYVPKSKINLGFGEGLGNVRLISADQDGNPTKPEGRNGTDAMKEVTNGDSANANVVDAPSSAPRRGRVPPGGFSSGLW